jgi:hypothetical protein
LIDTGAAFVPLDALWRLNPKLIGFRIGRRAAAKPRRIEELNIKEEL